MKHSLQTLRKSEQGFTLVELAVVMIIIGLLIGGILKGQELITNARITSTMSQIEGIAAARQDFQNQYNALAGDMANANGRLPNCPVATCGGPAVSNGVLNTNVGAAGTVGSEGGYFFAQLLAAGYITGMDGSAVASFGQAFPTANVGGGYLAGDSRAGTTGFTAGELRPAVYLVLAGNVGGAGVANSGILTAPQAQRIDTKLDDGAANTGSVVAETLAACRGVAVGGVTPYNTAAAGQTTVCTIAYRM